VFPITTAIAARSVELTPIHKYPFDRLIIAITLEYGAKLASVGTLLPKYPELENILM